MSKLRTYQLQNPDSASVNVELTQNGGAVVSGILTASSGVVGNVTGNVTGNLTGDVTGSAINVTGVITATSFSGDGSSLTGIDATQIVTGNTSVQTVDTGSDGHVKVTTEGTERVRINSSGNIGIGTDSTTVFGTAYRTVQLNPASGSGDGSAIRLMYDGGTANTNDLVIYTNSSQSYIRANGARNIDVMRNGSTVATFNANGIALPSGLGIDFSATSDASGSTSELLDDYEEGTWTPTLNGFTNAGIFQTAEYIKIGRKVTVYLNIFQSSNNMSFTATSLISGLPYTTIANFHTAVSAVAVDVSENTSVIASWLSPTTPVVKLKTASSSRRHLLLQVSYYTTT